MDDTVRTVLSQTRVAEFATVTRAGGVSVRPLSCTWSGGRIVFTTPIAYGLKAQEARRDARVAVLCSDAAGSGLPGTAAVLVEGTAHVADGVAAPQDIPEYWRTLIARNPEIAHEAGDAGYRADMEWYHLRLVIAVEPDEVHLLPGAPSGGATEPAAPVASALAEQIEDALHRYPTAVFAGRRADGRPVLTRAEVSWSGEQLRVTPCGGPGPADGPAALLWHRFGGPLGVMSALAVSGPARAGSDGWVLDPQRLAPTLDASSYQDWIDDGKARSASYLDRRHLDRPVVDWSVITGPSA